MFFRSVSSRRAGIFIRDCCVVATMALSATCVGFVFNQFRPNPLPMAYHPKAARVQEAAARLADASGAVPDGYSAASQLDLPGFQDVVEHRVSGIILDARPAVFYKLGHVPGAISLSRENFAADYARERKRLEADKSQIVVVYCSDPDCDDSQMVADGLVKIAFSRVFVFKGGWDDWTAAHLPEEKTP